jgi:hypothetical protein
MKTLRIFKFIGSVMFVMVMLCGLAAIVFDRLVVAPVLVKAQTILSGAVSSERALPEVVQRLLLRSLGARVKYHVARDLLEFPPSQIENMRTSKRQFTELGVGLLLPLYLSQTELLSLHAARAHMGGEIQGFAKGAIAHVGVPLEQVNLMQAAQLVVISRSPSGYLASPERLARAVNLLVTE